MRKDKKRWSDCSENCPQRILRRVLHEGRLGAMTSGEIYDAVVHAVLRERQPTWKDLDDVALELLRAEARYEMVRTHKGPTVDEFAWRLDLECGVLKWAMDELRARLGG